MDKKYGFTGETLTMADGTVLHQIYALRVIEKYRPENLK